MPYQPALFTGQEDLHDVLTFLQRELSKVGQAINDKVLQPGVNFVPPPKARDGNLAFADGGHWNPGSGGGVYAHIAGAWDKLLDSVSTFPITIAQGGTGQTSAQAARAAAGLNIDSDRLIGDTNATLVAADRVVFPSAAFTAARTWTLPVANTCNPGQAIFIPDFTGSITSTNTLTIATQGGDLYFGPSVIDVASCVAFLWTNGSNAWQMNLVRPFGATAGQAIKLDSSAKVPAGTQRTPTRQYLTSGTGATYTTPANCKWILVKMIGGGGGGGGATSGTGNGGNGGDTIFNSIHAAGGGGGHGVGVAALGAGGTGGTGAASLRLPGTGGGIPGTSGRGGFGAPGIFGTGGGQTNDLTGNGGNGGANTGAGGAGATLANQTGGGGAGEYVELIIVNPAATFTYTIGAGGTAGAGAQTGGVGGTGLIIVEEFY